MTSRYVLLAFLLIGGVLVTDTVWAESSQEIQEWKTQCDKGSAVGCFILGEMYYSGEGVTQDFVQAVDLYRCRMEEAAALFRT